MKRKLFLCLIIFSVVTVNFSQELQFTGYFENQFFPQRLNNEWILQDYNKLRLDLSADISENVTFNGNYNYRVYHGATTFSALDFLPDQLVNEYQKTMNIPQAILNPLFEFKQEDEYFLDNAYVSIYSKRVNIRIGKQQLPWGSGYSWNPTDIFNEKNLLDPTYEKVGVNAFKVEIPFMTEGMLTGIIGVEDKWKTSTKGIKLKQHLSGFDLSFSFVEKHQSSFDYYSLQQCSEKRRLLGGDFSGQLFGLGIWGEGAYNRMELSDNYGQYLVGSDYTFESGLYLTGEYYHNGLGRTNKENYTFGDWMRLMSSQGENLGQNYIFAGGSYPITELWNWSNFLLFNFDDKSGLIFPWFSYSLNDNTEVLFVGYLPFGSAKSEFGEFGAGGFARIRVYF